MALNLIKKDKSHSVVSIKLDEQEFHNIFIPLSLLQLHSDRSEERRVGKECRL